MDVTFWVVLKFLLYAVVSAAIASVALGLIIKLVISYKNRNKQTEKDQDIFRVKVSK